VTARRWETSEAAWAAAIERALSAKNGVWIVQERIPIRREVFPYIADAGRVDYRDMLVDFAPYLFRGKLCGFLTRLSATGLANVTSGGGQVPAFRVSPRSSAAMNRKNLSLKANSRMLALRAELRPANG